ncbi:hypothetical protein Poly30_03120 [Planctomycetes bacterium Poly30]|uniref:Uncharacterized protein n=1 Tax=Saltatorellus ferox TaxID=2528018 RepID=A0A518EL55_9BACT|nr:hypothetical protein Poly30_03120 [Planctomycetes bacterium Poly30]
MALALLASHSGFALPARDSQNSHVDPLVKINADVMVEGYLDSLESLVETSKRGSQWRAFSLVSDLRSQWLRVKLTSELRSDLVASAESLLQRIEQGRIDVFDVELLRLEVVNARLSDGIASFVARARAEEWSEEVFESAVLRWLHGTEIFDDAPEPDSYRARVIAALEFSLLTSSGTEAAAGGLSVEMLRLRLAIAIRRFEIARNRGDITALEFSRMQRMAIIRVRRITEDNF